MFSDVFLLDAELSRLHQESPATVNLMQYDLFSARIVSGSDINNNNDVPH